MAKQIRRRINTLRKRREKLLDELVALQEECTHPTAEKRYKGNTGNYDPSVDSYWIDWSCPICDKTWQTEQ